MLRENVPTISYMKTDTIKRDLHTTSPSATA